MRRFLACLLLLGLGLSLCACGQRGGSAYGVRTIETLVEQNPEIIFVTSMGKLDEVKRGMEETIASNPAWQTIPAVKNGKMYYLSQEHFLLSPGIHYPDAVEEMAKLIYPDLFR